MNANEASRQALIPDQLEMNDVGADEEEADVESSKGSAWPSETSRLTPLQSNYQGQQPMQQPAQELMAAQI